MAYGLFMSDTNNTTKLGPRPAPHLISFAPECFVDGPTVTEWEITKLAPGYPERFSRLAEAEARGRVLGRQPHAVRRTPRVRVRWF